MNLKRIHVENDGRITVTFRFPLGQHDSKGASWCLAACHRTPCRAYIGSMVFIVEGIISRLNKNSNAYTRCTRQPGYRYQMVKRRRKLLKEGYKFNRKTRGGVGKEVISP